MATAMITFRMLSIPQHSYVLPAFLLMSTCKIQFHGSHGVHRWHEDTVCWLEPFASGQRCLLRPVSQARESRSRELWDFNPYRVRRLGKNFRLESEKASLSVETEPSCAKSRGIKDGVYSSLPFVKIVPKRWPDYDYMGVYDDRIYGQMVRTFYNS
jgi:hypothetical protein